MTLVAWLVAMVGPLVARLLVSLGVTLVTITGVAISVAALKSLTISSIGSLPLAMIQLGGLLGLWQSFGIVLGTYTFLIAFKTTAGFKAVVKS